MHLFEANEQWTTRPPDERFSSLPEMLKVCHGYQKDACQATVSFKSLKATADEESKEVKITGREGLSAKLTHWAFGQISNLAKAPASYLRRLPPSIAADCLNYGFSQNTSDKAPLELLFQPTHNNVGQLPLPNTAMMIPDHLLLRALTSEKYTRIWNWEIVERLISLTELGWRIPPARPAFRDQPGTRPATEKDVLESKGVLSINVGDPIAPAGLYASDHDMFAFLINEENRIDDGSAHGLSRGVFFENSEVGAKALRCTTFLYRHVCGNHIVWDASNVSKLRWFNFSREKTLSKMRA